MERLTIVSIFGTRPEAIKMAPVIKELEKQSNQFKSVVVITAQHREMLDQVLRTFDIQPDYDLNIMRSDQTLSEVTANVLIGLEEVFMSVQPDMVLVHGDTTSSFVASLAAFYHQIPIGHVEAGLRTYEKYAPFPEEVNRQLTDVLADLYFAPTENSKVNLVQEGRNEKKIFVTGNTAIDTLRYTLEIPVQNTTVEIMNQDKRWILLTMHRRENQGEPMKQVCQAILKVVETHKDVEVILPIHPNPKVAQIVESMLSNHPQIHLVSSMDTKTFHQVISKSFIIATDSGGIQEEAPSLGVPVLVLRNQTERPEGVEAGTLKVIGTQMKDVYREIVALLEDKQLYQQMANTPNPYGDGFASQRIVEAILYHFGRTSKRPTTFEPENRLTMSHDGSKKA